MHLVYHQYIQLLSVVAGFMCIGALRRNLLLWFLYLSLLGLITDGLSVWVMALGLPNNYFIINLYSVVGAPLVYAGFYRHLLLSHRNKKIYKISAAILTAGFVADFFFINDFNQIDAYSVIFFYFFNIILCCGWLFKTAMREDIFRFDQEPMFWISAGLLIFSIGTLITLGMNQFIRMNQLTIENQFIYRIIMPALNVILYSSFTYAFILCRLRKKSYSPSSSSLYF